MLVPPPGGYHTDLSRPKFFTITKRCDYSSPWMGCDEVYLEYPVLRSLQLIDNRDLEAKDHENCDGYDGYIEIGDCIEIYLKSPAFVLGKHVEIPFSAACDRCAKAGSVYCRSILSQHITPELPEEIKYF